MRRLVMRAEIGAESPLWDEEGDMVSLASLPLGSELQDALTKWADVGWEDPNQADTKAEGRRLYERVVDALGATLVLWDND